MESKTGKTGDLPGMNENKIGKRMIIMRLRKRKQVKEMHWVGGVKIK